MLLADYASGSEGSDTESGPSRAAVVASKITAPSLPAPSTISSVPKRKRPIKITLDLPKSGNETREHEVDDDSELPQTRREEEQGEVKRAKTGGSGIKGGKGSSSLLGMLPAPKRKLPVGKGDSRSTLAVNKSMAAKVPNPLSSVEAGGEDNENENEDEDADEDQGSKAMGMLPPPSLARGKAKAAVSGRKAAASLDLFGLTPTPGQPSSSSSSTQALRQPSISSAPSIPDFVPPPPTPQDPYPGYYLLPSGQWAAYDPAYYHSFFPDSTTPQKGEDGRVGKHWDEYDAGRAQGDLVDVSVSQGVEEARREEERRESMKVPLNAGNDFDYKPVGQIKGLAAERHQLSSLLNTAYLQRDALEDKIRQNKKNMRLAGTKYGF